MWRNELNMSCQNVENYAIFYLLLNCWELSLYINKTQNHIIQAFPCSWAKQKLYSVTKEQAELLNIVPPHPSLITLGLSPAGTCTGLALCTVSYSSDLTGNWNPVTLKKKKKAFLFFYSCQLIKNSWVKISLLHRSQELFWLFGYLVIYNYLI